MQFALFQLHGADTLWFCMVPSNATKKRIVTIRMVYQFSSEKKNQISVDFNWITVMQSCGWCKI